jgi:hypothetical protein
MNLQYTLTQDDYLKAQALFTRNSGALNRVAAFALPVIGGLMLAGAVVNLLASPKDWSSTAFLFVWGSLLIFSRKFSLIRSFKKAGRR